jgi:hypothetical protein
MKQFDKKDIFTCVNAEDAMSYIGDNGYFADSLSGFYHIDCYAPYSLDKVRIGTDHPFVYRTKSFALFLPANKVKEVEEPKYRPFKSTSEFLKFYKVGQVIHLKNKNDNLEQLTSIVAVFIRCYCCVCLGINHGALAFEDLFKKYEIEIDGKWQPFGVEE